MMTHAISPLHTTLPPASTFSFAFTRSILEGFTRFSKVPEKYHAQREYCNVSPCLCMKKQLSGETNERYERDRRRPRRSGYKSSGGLITLKRSEGKWTDSWTSEHFISLEALGLKDLASEAEGSNDEVVVTLSIQKHAGFGYSVDGRVIAPVSRKCIYCCAKCSNQVDASFNAWCIPTDSSFSVFQKAGEVDDDPSIIYFLPGREEAILDDFVRDAIRLSCSTEATCSDACEKSGLGKWEFDYEKSNSIDKRWLPILKAKIN